VVGVTSTRGYPCYWHEKELDVNYYYVTLRNKKGEVFTIQIPVSHALNVFEAEHLAVTTHGGVVVATA
jgi:hypothetical protein